MGTSTRGPIAICELIRELDPGEVQGRLILMPANNVHAVVAGRRTSPVDGLNFNRTFPGDPRGTITQQIAAYITDHLYPLADAFLDLHSGGSSLDILPSAIVEPTDDPGLTRRNIEAVQAFDAPMTVVISNLGEPRTATAAACRAGLVTVGSEMGGGGTVSLEALAICRRGVRNVLAHLGVLGPEHVSPRRGDGRILELPARMPMSSPRWTASSSPFTPTAPRSGRASPPAASTAPGTPPGSPRRCAIRLTASSMAGGSRAGSGPAIAASSSPLPTRASLHDHHRRHRGCPDEDRRPCPAHADHGAGPAQGAGAGQGTGEPEARMPPGHGLVQGEGGHEPPARHWDGSPGGGPPPAGIVTASGGNHGLAVARTAFAAACPPRSSCRPASRPPRSRRCGAGTPTCASSAMSGTSRTRRRWRMVPAPVPSTSTLSPTRSWCGAGHARPRDAGRPAGHGCHPDRHRRRWPDRRGGDGASCP